MSTRNPSAPDPHVGQIAEMLPDVYFNKPPAYAGVAYDLIHCNVQRRSAEISRSVSSSARTTTQGDPSRRFATFYVSAENCQSPFSSQRDISFTKIFLFLLHSEGLDNIVLEDKETGVIGGRREIRWKAAQCGRER